MADERPSRDPELPANAVGRAARADRDAGSSASTRFRRGLADIDYFLAEPLGWREGTVVVWAGMRGAVTLAAAQTLPEDAPERSLLVLIAFLVAAVAVLQGGTLPRVVELVEPARDADAGRTRTAGALLGRGGGRPAATAGGAAFAAQRTALLDARDDGTSAPAR